MTFRLPFFLGELYITCYLLYHIASTKRSTTLKALESLKATRHCCLKTARLILIHITTFHLNGSSYLAYLAAVNYHYDKIAFVHNYHTDIGERDIQNEFILVLDNALAVYTYIKHKRESNIGLMLVRYKRATFLHTISQVLVAVGSIGSKVNARSIFIQSIE